MRVKSLLDTFGQSSLRKKYGWARLLGKNMSGQGNTNGKNMFEQGDLWKKDDWKRQLGDVNVWTRLCLGEHDVWTKPYLPKKLCERKFRQYVKGKIVWTG